MKKKIVISITTNVCIFDNYIHILTLKCPVPYFMNLHFTLFQFFSYLKENVAPDCIGGKTHS